MKENQGYVIIGYNPKTKLYVGYVETSLTMTFDALRARVFWSEDYKDTYNSFKYGFISEYLKTQYKGIAKWKINSLNQFAWYILRSEVNSLNTKKYNNFTWKLYKVNSKNCPVKIDFSEFNAMKAKKIKYNSYYYRNPKFAENEIK